VAAKIVIVKTRNNRKDRDRIRGSEFTVPVGDRNQDEESKMGVRGFLCAVDLWDFEVCMN
jgi:hypothetical protein